MIPQEGDEHVAEPPAMIQQQGDTPLPLDQVLRGVLRVELEEHLSSLRRDFSDELCRCLKKCSLCQEQPRRKFSRNSTEEEQPRRKFSRNSTEEEEVQKPSPKRKSLRSVSDVMDLWKMSPPRRKALGIRFASEDDEVKGPSAGSPRPRTSITSLETDASGHHARRGSPEELRRLSGRRRKALGIRIAGDDDEDLAVSRRKSFRFKDIVGGGSDDASNGNRKKGRVMDAQACIQAKPRTSRAYTHSPIASSLSTFEELNSLDPVVPVPPTLSHDVPSAADTDIPGSAVGSLAVPVTTYGTRSAARDDVDSEDGEEWSATISQDSRIRRCSLCLQRLALVRQAAKSLAERPAFDYCVSGLIILSSIWLGAQTDFMVSHVSEDLPRHFRIAEATFLAFFTVELILRVGVYGSSFFFMPEWRWNVFDATLITVQLTEELVAIVMRRDTTMHAKFNAARILRILRLVRIVRLVRLFRFVQELQTMVCSIANSFRSLCWTIVLLIFMIYIVSVYLTQLIADHGQSNPHVFKDDKALQEYYSSLPKCFLSLFQAITGGVAWGDVLSPLTTNISPLLAVVFSIYICFAVLAMMNVITGVFVESAVTAAKADRDSEMLTRLHALFFKIDANRSGLITWEEFANWLDDPQMEHAFKALDIDASEAYGLFALLDVNECGEISVEEFVLGCIRLRGPAQAIDLATLTYLNKRLSTRFRQHAQRVETSLKEIIELFPRIAGQEVQQDSPVPTDQPPNPTLLGSIVEECNDAATWAEMKAKGATKAAISRQSTPMLPALQNRSPSRSMSFESVKRNFVGSRRSCENTREAPVPTMPSTPLRNEAKRNTLTRCSTEPSSYQAMRMTLTSCSTEPSSSQAMRMTLTSCSTEPSSSQAMTNTVTPCSTEPSSS
eukprot:TRINITY_DN5718_c0_g1_i1.p1 TRINITY_DN5718_c0_g1~~TRINITY_DN5718_c0_g1_i1.p1  ORF type:complete len:897 (+),score=138.85 TRINITY_DN5718_c0_g1_i1:91-2781(+)